MHCPPIRMSGALHCPPPLNEARLLPDMDLLSTPDQADHHAPLGDTLGELNEVFRLRLVAAVLWVLSTPNHEFVPGFSR